MEQKYLVAFEIGSSCIKGAVATTDPGTTGRVNILAVETEPLIDKVRYGCVENPGDVASCVTNICHRLQATPGISPRAIKEVYVGLSGRSMTSIPHEVSRDFHSEIEITRRDIDDLLRHASSHSVDDKEVVAVEPGTFIIDNQVAAAPVGMLGHILSANVNLVACRPKIKNNLKRVFNERCSLNIARFIVTPLAMGTQLLTVEDRRLGVMLVDFGAETTTVAIYRDGALVYLATIPMGSRNITRDITSLNCLEERAEEIKKAVGSAVPPASDGISLVTDGLDNTEINNIVSARADEIISNIFEQINYAGLKPEQLVAGIVVTGGGARLRGFNDQLTKQTQLKVRQAGIGAGINIAGKDFNPNEALDVISIIAEAAATNPVDCTEMPPIATIDTVTAMAHNTTPTIDSHRDTDPIDPDDIEQFASSLNGRDDDDDNSILIDDPDPDEIKPVQPSKRVEKEKEKEKEKNKKKEKSSDNKFWKSLSDRLSNMLKDDSEFES